ncbi:hypothetical protein K7X08_022131 [Anisodus acutangulus]|uniref:Uncharacterized protein n=1 Tax=Anisodus acutangulus TaxID=402998 RepID=A0A9Q1L6Q0_9SOLA|nr:hypothetical protein K7X08_022131 [Anisodus acutangulus]
MRQNHVRTRWKGHQLQHLTDFDDSLDKGVGKQECISPVMSGPSFSLHIDDSQSVSVGSPKLNQGDSKSYDDPKTQNSEEVNEAVAGKDVDNVKRKGKEKVAADVVSEQAREVVLPQGGDVESADTGNEFIDSRVEKMSESVLAPPPEDVVQPKTDQLADEVLAKVEDIVKDCGVGPSGASGGDNDSEEEAPDFVIPPDTNVVEINDDQTTLVAPRRGRSRRPANVKKSTFVPVSDLSELGETPLKPVKGRSLLMLSITSHC